MPPPSLPSGALRWEGENGLDFLSKSSLTFLGRRGREASSRAGPFSAAIGQKGEVGAMKKGDLRVSLNFSVYGAVKRTVLSAYASYWLPPLKVVEICASNRIC